MKCMLGNQLLKGLGGKIKKLKYQSLLKMKLVREKKRAGHIVCAPRDPPMKELI